MKTTYFAVRLTALCSLEFPSSLELAKKKKLCAKSQKISLIHYNFHCFKSALCSLEFPTSLEFNNNKKEEKKLHNMPVDDESSAVVLV